MHTLSTKPAVASSCKISSRRCIASPARVISSSRRRSVQGCQRRNIGHYRLAAIPDEQNADRGSAVDEGVARLERWGDKLDEFGTADTSNIEIHAPSATGERGPSEVAVFEEGTGPAENRAHKEPHKLEDKADLTAASSSSTMTSDRDTSDMQNASPGSSSSGVLDPESARLRAEESETPAPRVHPVARTAGAAAVSAAGTIIGAAAGPVGAAAGAAIGAALGRRAADLIGGTEEQGEVYEAGAELEQVAEDVMSAGAAVSHTATDAADTLQAKANELVDRASERLHRDSSRSGSDRVQGSDRDADLADQTLLSGELDSLDLIVDTDQDQDSSRSGTSHKSRRSKVSDVARSAADRVAGAAELLKETAVDAAHTAADKIGDAADHIPLPEFPPSSDRDEGDFHSAGGGARLEDDKTLQAARERVSGAAESARDRLGSAAEEAKDRARSAAAAAKDRLGGAGDRAAAAAGSTARTAADYGSTDTSERLQEMSQQGASTTRGPAQSTSAPGTIPDSDWGSSRDLGGLPANAEDIVKADVGSPTEGSSLMQSDNMPLASEISSSSSSSGGAISGGGYGDAAADLDVDVMRGGGGVSDSVRSWIYNTDSTAERVADVYGVGPEASSGAQEADTYRAEAGSDTGFSSKGSQGSESGTKSNMKGNKGGKGLAEGGDLLASERERLGVAGQEDSFAAAVDDAAAAADAVGEGEGRSGGAQKGSSSSSEAEKLAAFVEQRGDESEQGLGNAPQRRA